MKLTQIKFYRHTPLTNFNDTIHFDSNAKRDQYFKEHYQNSEVIEKENINYERTRDPLVLSISKEKFIGFNYGSFVSDFEPNIIYYFFLVGTTKYQNDNSTSLSIIIDPVMTFTQGNILESLNNLTIERQHLSKADYLKYDLLLRTNDDVLKTTTKQYIDQSLIRFKEFYVVFTSGVDLRKEFGDVDKPIINSSKGQNMDNLSSPLDLYVCTQSDFQDFMSEMSAYPWVTQTFNQITLLPIQFFTADMLEAVEIKGVDFKLLFTFVNNTQSIDVSFPEHNKSFNQLCDIFGFNPIYERHLLRSEYTTTEIYTWDGQGLLLDNGFLNSFELIGISVLGYKNEVAIFPKNYKSSQLNSPDIYQGTFLNDAIILNAFSDVPISVNNATLQMANSANNRELTNSKLLVNRADNILDGKASVESRLFDTMNVAQTLSISAMMNRLSDDYNQYQKQQADIKDLAMTLPTITNQTNSYGLQMANEIFGLTIKHSMPNIEEMNNIRKYYSTFGFATPFVNSKLSGVHTNNICNYLKFTGSWELNGVPIEFIEQLRVLFENGIRFWHDDRSKNPIQSDVVVNHIIS